MYRLAIAVLLPAMISAADFHIDHVTVAGSSIKQMQSALAAVGIASVYGGPHIDRVTEMALVSFPDGSYLEFIGLQKGAAADLTDHHAWAKYLRGDAGPTAWALRVDQMPVEVRRLKGAGVTVSEPQRSGRDRPDGVHLEWETASVGSEPRGTFFAFLIHDFTSRDQRAFPSGQPVTRDFRGVARIVIGVHDLDAAVKRYRKAYGLPEPTKQEDRQFGARLAIMPGSPIVLAQPLTGDSWLTKRVAQFGDLPCAFVLQSAGSAKYKVASTSTWSGSKISWFDSAKLGWRLGFEE